MIQPITSPFQTPVGPGIMCVILDASFDPDMQARIEQAISFGVERCVPLLDNTPYNAVQSVGPFALLCPYPDALAMYAGNLLEQADAGCVAYLKEAHAFEQAVEHWRSLLTVSTDDAAAQMLRFFDPRWLEPLLNSLEESELAQFMGPMTAMAWRNGLGWRQQAHPEPLLATEAQPPGWLHLGHERQEQIAQQRLKVLAARFAQDYQAVLPLSEPTAFVYRQLLAAQKAGYLQPAEQERWLRLALRQGEGFSNLAAAAAILARDDLGLGDKLLELERL
ncbi:DUF4123 domain-containing protein [Pseudomonas sp. H9]|uniref:DUF4123 domain-containing protein n=1 Tax=Pseudomonas sp. H9 TaxID=483968 RepID=UPI00105833C2|nr:DUF4123 domain-containing protein [Pseudomonas sp. H9]TDF82477.1 DUF4123 domain-containing protein [Pseudomonas sp. H9]